MACSVARYRNGAQPVIRQGMLMSVQVLAVRALVGAIQSAERPPSAQICAPSVTNAEAEDGTCRPADSLRMTRIVSTGGAWGTARGWGCLRIDLCSRPFGSRRPSLRKYCSTVDSLRDDFLKDRTIWINPARPSDVAETVRSEEHTSELQSQFHLVCRLLLLKNI